MLTVVLLDTVRVRPSAFLRLPRMGAVMSVPVILKKAVIQRDGGFCLLALPGCLGEAQTTDHRANRGMGGAPILDDPCNLIAACSLCNGAKADAHQMVLNNLERRGLYVIPNSTHAKTLARVRQTPVEYLDGERFYLLSELDPRGGWILARLHVSEVMKVGH